MEPPDLRPGECLSKIIFLSTYLSYVYIRFSLLGFMNELTGGLTSVRDASTLLEQAESDWPAVQKRLENIRKKIMTKKSSLIVNLTGDRKTLDVAKTEYSKLIHKLPIADTAATEKSIIEEWKSQSKALLLPMKNEGFAIPSQVNYVCKGA